MVTTLPRSPREPDTYRGRATGVRRYFESFEDGDGRRPGRAARLRRPRRGRVIVEFALRARRAQRRGIEAERVARSQLGDGRRTGSSCRGSSVFPDLGLSASSRLELGRAASRPRGARSQLARARSRSGRRRSTAAGRARRRRSPGRRPATIGRIDVLEALAARLAGAVGAGLEDRAHRRPPAARRSAARRAARGPRGRRADSGARGWRRPASPGPGSSAAIASRVRGPRLAISSRIASGEKYMTADGLPSSRPLSAWMRSIAAASSGSQASP